MLYFKWWYRFYNYNYLVKKYKQDIESFVVSLGEGNSQSDDIKFARIAAKEFGIKLHELILTEKEVLSKLKEVVYVVEQSRWQNIGSAIVQIFLGKLINQKGFKVVFSGDLSDEIFGSYGHIQRYYYKPDDYDKIRRKLVEKVHETNFITSNQAFMWGGTIETRTPYSWRPFVEYSLNVPTKYRLINGHMKYLLRKAFEGEISANLLWRRKVPFTEGARTANLIETKKELLKTYLKDIFKYKDNKYTQEVLF